MKSKHLMLLLLCSCGTETDTFSPLFPQLTYELSDPERVLDTCGPPYLHPTTADFYTEDKEYFADIELEGTHTISGEEHNTERNGHFILYTYEDDPRYFIQMAVKPMEDYLHFGWGVRIEPEVCLYVLSLSNEVI